MVFCVFRTKTGDRVAINPDKVVSIMPGNNEKTSDIIVSGCGEFIYYVVDHPFSDVVASLENGRSLSTYR